MGALRRQVPNLINPPLPPGLALKTSSVGVGIGNAAKITLCPQKRHKMGERQTDGKYFANPPVAAVNWLSLKNN